MKPVPYMTPLVAADFDILAISGGLPNGTFSNLQMELCSDPVKTSCSRNRGGHRRTLNTPSALLIFSPGFGQSRLVYNAMAQSLASEGYVVVTIDHPYDADVVEFPDGNYVLAANISSEDDAALDSLLEVRAKDVSFVIDQLQNSSALTKTVEKSGNAIDFSKIVMYGHSLGGATAATVMPTDSRIRGGVNVDGRFFTQAMATGVGAPFMNVGRPDHRLEDTTWDTFFNVSKGPLLEVEVAGTLHAAFTDFPVVIGTSDPTSPEVIAGLQTFVGTIPWLRAGVVVAKLVAAFTESVLDHQNSTILSGSDSNFPEVKLVRSHQ
ncbi:hypothetical protein KJ359_007207 [Pestalotiopsis sp. 9143b]|nr:hypothetical protein KJ359_007207 [Pestalotiopsis sp. 9143b]